MLWVARKIPMLLMVFFINRDALFSRDNLFPITFFCSVAGEPQNVLVNTNSVHSTKTNRNKAYRDEISDLELQLKYHNQKHSSMLGKKILEHVHLGWGGVGGVYVIELKG